MTENSDTTGEFCVSAWIKFLENLLIFILYIFIFACKIFSDMMMNCLVKGRDEHRLSRTVEDF